MNSLLKLSLFSVVVFAMVVIWSSVIFYPTYVDIVNGVTTLRTHTIYLDGVSESQQKISIWRIKLPEGIPRSSVGDWIFDDFDQNRRGRYHGIGLASWLKEGNIVDNPTNQQQHDPSDEYFAIGISNGLLQYVRLADKDYCIPEGGIDNAKPCSKSTPSCTVYVNYHGWDAHAVVPRNTLYKTPELVCDILRKKLDEWTISIDDLRQPRRVGPNG